MKIKWLGKIDLPGGVEPGICLVSKDYMVLILRWRDTCTAVGLRLNLSQHSLELAWHRELLGNVYYQWAGYPLAINFPSIVPANQNQLYLIGGTERLLIKAESGEVIKKTISSASPSAPVTLTNTELLVPEGQSIYGYDLKNLNKNWSISLPEHQWIFNPVFEKFVLLQSEIDENTLLWDVVSNQFWLLPECQYPSAGAKVTDSLILVPSGGALLESLLAFNLYTHSVQWRLQFPRLIPYQSPDENRFLVRYPAVYDNNYVFIVTAKPSLEALSIFDGTCIWSIPLAASPTTLTKYENMILIGTFTGEIIAVNIANGATYSTTKLPILPVEIIPLSDKHNSLNIMIIGRLKDIYIWNV